MARQPIGSVVAGCFTAGLIGAVALVLGPIAGAEEYVTTGSLLLVSGASWGLVVILSALWTSHPQRWAALPAGFMALAGAGLLAFAPGQLIDVGGHHLHVTCAGSGAAFRRVSGLLPSLARLGVGRLVFHDSFGELPAGVRGQERRSYSSARFFRSQRDEFAALPASLTQARSLETLGNRPLVVVTAARDAQAGWLPLQDRMAMLSTNSSHRILPYSHTALVTDREAAQASSQAVRDVVHAVRYSVPLAR
jgi:hypothetical protein